MPPAPAPPLPLPCCADLNLLKHDKPLAASGAAAAAAHLKHIPAYLRDPTLQGKSFVGNSGEAAPAAGRLEKQPAGREVQAEGQTVQWGWWAEATCSCRRHSSAPPPA